MHAVQVLKIMSHEFTALRARENAATCLYDTRSCQQMLSSVASDYLIVQRHLRDEIKLQQSIGIDPEISCPFVKHIFIRSWEIEPEFEARQIPVP